jgi:hypothetical protein
MGDLTSASCMFCKSETFVVAEKLTITHISMRELNMLLFLSSEKRRIRATAGPGFTRTGKSKLRLGASQNLRLEYCERRRIIGIKSWIFVLAY